LVTIRRERRGKRFFVVVRDDDNNVLSSRRWSQTRFNLAFAREKFRLQGSLQDGVSVNRKLSKLDEFTQMKAVTRKKDGTFGRRRLSKPPRAAQDDRGRMIVQYQVTGTFRGVRITGRSSKLGTPLSKTPDDARERAYKNFFARIGNLAQGQIGYDSDTGMKFIDEVKNVVEGWVYYRRRR
jgi:hypothetical protein